MNRPVEESRCSSFEEELDRVNPDRERFLLEKIRKFLERIQPGDKVLIACHPDADGFVSGTLLKVFLDRYFKGQVRAEFCTDTLDTQEFYEKAKTCNHVITGDLWIDPREEKQKGLRALSERGINIMIFDHHDEDFHDIDPSRIDEMLMSGMNYTSSIPETIGQNMNPQTRGEIVYVSPKRLGFMNPDPDKFTAGLVVYKMLSQLANLRDLEFLLPISAKGDDAGKKFWPKLVEKYGEHDDKIKEIAAVLNLGKNLTNDAVKRLIERLSSMKTIQNPFETIKESSELADLKKLREYIRRKLNQILEHVTPINQRFLHYHVTQQDEQDARREINGDLKARLELNVGISEAVCEEMGRRNTVIVTQMDGTQPKRTLNVCFKDDRDDMEYDMNRLAKHFGGGGHANASRARIPILQGWKEESVIADFTARIRRIADSY